MSKSGSETLVIISMLPLDGGHRTYANACWVRRNQDTLDLANKLHLLCHIEFRVLVLLGQLWRKT